MKTQANDPAFAQHPDRHFDHGLTKREYFAAMALQGLLVMAKDDDSMQFLARQSVKMADALIEELNKKAESDES
jgi:hypothetical protein